MSAPTENKPSYSNLEILNLVIMALAYGSPDKVKEMEGGGTIIMRSWQALDETFEKGYKQGRERGYEEGYHAAKAEMQTAEEAAEAAAHQVIEGLCKTVWKKVA
jgi:hypothetical protein